MFSLIHVFAAKLFLFATRVFGSPWRPRSCTLPPTFRRKMCAAFAPGGHEQGMQGWANCMSPQVGICLEHIERNWITSKIQGD